MALPTVEVETPSPKCSSKTWRCSSRVRSSLASRCLGSHSLSIAPFLEGLPGIGPGSTSPVSRRLFIQRFMVGIDTEKVLATSSLGVPASTAASTLNLRSFEYGFMPGGYHIWIDTYGCRCKALACHLDFAQNGAPSTRRETRADSPGECFRPRMEFRHFQRELGPPPCRPRLGRHCQNLPQEPLHPQLAGIRRA